MRVKNRIRYTLDTTDINYGKSTAIPHKFHNGENAAMWLNQYLQGKSKVELL